MNDDGTKSSHHAHLAMRQKELLRLKRINNLAEVISPSEWRALKTNRPLQKILGFINYGELIINVNKRVFIPRLETVEVVNAALRYIKPSDNVLDLCAGSGFIGLSIKQKVDVDVTLVDISRAAIKQIKFNAQFNQLDVKVVRSNLFSKVRARFDIIVANPPYLVQSMPLPESVTKYEPKCALYGGVSGNDFYARILAQVETFLQPNAVVIFEIGPDNEAYLKAQGFSIENDINKLPRIAIKRF